MSNHVQLPLLIKCTPNKDCSVIEGSGEQQTQAIVSVAPVFFYIVIVLTISENHGLVLAFFVSKI